MPYALVGTESADTQSAAGGTATPSWGTGQTRAAGNLLICHVAGANGTTFPATPSGWSIAKQQVGTLSSATIFYKIAAGADAAPAITGSGSIVWSVKVNEFSGNAASSPLDKTGGAAGTTTPLAPTAGSADVAAGELVVCTISCFYSSATGAKTSTDSLNNGATATVTQNANATVNHFDHCWGITTSKAAADANSCTIVTTNLSGAAGAIASFLVLAASRPAVTVVGQAVQRATSRCWGRRPSGIVVPRLWTPEDGLAVI